MPGKKQKKSKSTLKKTPKAPWGRKADGTPRAKPGRKPQT